MSRCKGWEAGRQEAGAVGLVEEVQAGGRALEKAGGAGAWRPSSLRRRGRSGEGARPPHSSSLHPSRLLPPAPQPHTDVCLKRPHSCLVLPRGHLAKAQKSPQVLENPCLRFLPVSASWCLHLRLTSIWILPPRPLLASVSFLSIRAAPEACASRSPRLAWSLSFPRSLPSVPPH